MDKTTAYEALPTWAKNLYSQTKARSKKRENAFELTKDGYAAMVTDRCALTGIVFDTVKAENRTRHHKRPYAPSIDRIDNSRGYADDNVRIVCVAVNLAMNTWGEEVLFKIAANLMNMQRDQRKWRGTANKLPEGVKRESISINGARYSARVRHNDERIYLGCFGSIEEADAAVAKAKSDILRLGYCPPITLKRISRKNKPTPPLCSDVGDAVVGAIGLELIRIALHINGLE